MLAILAAGLLIAFGGVTDRLIPLFALGAFLSFTLSQAGMVAHWRKQAGGRARVNMAINALGALATGATVVIVAVAKFTEGAWRGLVPPPPERGRVLGYPEHLAQFLKFSTFLRWRPRKLRTRSSEYLLQSRKAKERKQRKWELRPISKPS